MKVLLLINSFGAGGAQNQMKNLALGFKDKDIDFEVLTYSEGDHFKKELNDAGIKVNLVKKNSRFDLLLPLRIFFFCKKNNITHIIAFLFTPSFYGILCKLFSFCKIKLIVSERSFYKKSKVENFVRLFYPLVDFITANSIHQSEYLKKKYPGLIERIQFIPNGIKIEISKDLLPQKELKEFKILCVGRVQKIKNVELIINLLNYLVSDLKKDVTVDWVGSEKQIIEGKVDPYFYECVNLIEKYELSNRWNWLGRRSDVKNLMKQSDLMIHASSGEGFPNVIIEAMDVGCIVLASDFGDHPKVIKDGVNGFIFNLESIDQIKSKIFSILNLNEHRKKDIVNEARKTVLTNFSISKLADNYLNLLKNI